MFIVLKHNDGEGCSLQAEPYAARQEAEDAVMKDIDALIADSGKAYQQLVDDCEVLFDGTDASLELYGVFYEWAIQEISNTPDTPDSAGILRSYVDNDYQATGDAAYVADALAAAGCSQEDAEKLGFSWVYELLEDAR